MNPEEQSQIILELSKIRREVETIKNQIALNVAFGTIGAGFILYLAIMIFGTLRFR